VPENGRLPPQLLAPIPGGFLAKEPAGAWNAMSAQARERFGVELRPTGPDSSYRKYERQVYWRKYWCDRGKCANAAVPGTSNHGLGLAVDVPQATRNIVDEIGEPFGWAKKWSDAPQEPWHIKYRAGIFSGAAAASVDPLTKHERQLVDELQKLRATAHAAGEWGKPARARAREIKRWIARQRERIRAAATQSGWETANRRARYDLLAKVYTG
jgi:D-alanyl-D-alanine carboxypeptidase